MCFEGCPFCTLKFHSDVESVQFDQRMAYKESVRIQSEIENWASIFAFFGLRYRRGDDFEFTTSLYRQTLKTWPRKCRCISPLSKLS